MPDPALIAALRLTLTPGVGPRIRQTLIDAFGAVDRIFAAQRSELLELPGIGPKLADAITAAAQSDEPERELRRCDELGVKLILKGTDEYPAMLSELPDAPPVLYVRGELLPQDQLALAIVGSRGCTYYGQRQTEKIAGGLARAAVTVVSGLARGIDGHAHRAALNAGGRTIAVTATGMETVYPPEHADLSDEITANGAIVTEFRLDQKPLAGLFPQRNRIISGLSLGVILTEASRKSGALHTARHAVEQNREVFAIPGPIDSGASEGCHDLIRDGATLIRGVDDVLEALGPLRESIRVPVTERGRRPKKNDRDEPSEERTVASPAELLLTDQERQVLDAVAAQPEAVDLVLERAAIEPGRTLATLTMLEMKRLVRRLPGNRIVRSS
ncbi:DNA-processing protein DprA [Stratiformator vulcanicus]|uniref:Helix-hairpin-helix DNA-binding motif class 1 domain-containing protein n=1 Tax=Stratiformator vulcanicus TaxID=2527980 RepID=A0A517QXF2_9PLAN|nr:DNA-processing protein DprA [Stratiformator vulcanicus]QDT36346.1 hypothetical protein Pan189_07020 [Stratiformator vulcanicus]